jgi:hypothetical protein
MIEAKVARELADNITSKEALKQIEQINELILAAASTGLFSIDITREEISPCVEHYLTFLKYKVKKILDDNQYVIKREISWK